MSVAALAFLFVGYLASQIAALNGPVAQADYATKADAAPIRALASLFFFGAIVLALVPERESPT